MIATFVAQEQDRRILLEAEKRVGRASNPFPPQQSNLTTHHTPSCEEIVSSVRREWVKLRQGMMADDEPLQGQPPHLANGSRGRSQLLPYQPHGFTGYEPNRPASMPSTPRRHGEAPGPPRVNPDVRAGMPASGSGTQAPAQVWRMLREVVHLHRGDEEASCVSSKRPLMQLLRGTINTPS